MVESEAPADVTTDRLSGRAGDETGCCVFGDVLGDDDADVLASRLKALADPTRIKLVSLIANAPAGEVCACDLPEAVGKSQPTTSHHLRLLAEAGLIHREQRGKWAWFRLDHDRLATVRDALGAPPTDRQ